MTIGGSIFLLALGAILAFAVDGTLVAGIDIPTVGYILMAAGLLGLILGLVMMNQNKNQQPPQGPPAPPQY